MPEAAKQQPAVQQHPAGDRLPERRQREGRGDRDRLRHGPERGHGSAVQKPVLRQGPEPQVPAAAAAQHHVLPGRRAKRVTSPTPSNNEKDLQRRGRRHGRDRGQVGAALGRAGRARDKGVEQAHLLPRERQDPLEHGRQTVARPERDRHHGPAAGGHRRGRRPAVPARAADNDEGDALHQELLLLLPDARRLREVAHRAALPRAAEPARPVLREPRHRHRARVSALQGARRPGALHVARDPRKPAEVREGVPQAGRAVHLAPAHRRLLRLCAGDQRHPAQPGLPEHADRRRQAHAAAPLPAERRRLEPVPELRDARAPRGAHGHS